MSGATVITVVGNITSDPELRYTQNGKPVANFTVAAGERVFNRETNAWADGDTLYMRCTAWNDLAEHVAGSLEKGTRVIVTGSLKQRSYETKPVDGSAPEKRTTFELRVDEVGPSLKYATASVLKVRRPGSDFAPDDEPWVVPTVDQGAMV